MIVIADIDTRIQFAAVSDGFDLSAEQVGMLADMGFTPAQVVKPFALLIQITDIYLYICRWVMQRVVEWLFSHPEDTGRASSEKVNVGGTKELPAQYRRAGLERIGCCLMMRKWRRL